MRQLRRILELAVGGAALTALLACGRPPHPAVSTAPLAPGVYRAVLTLPGGELPFGFEVVEVDGHKSVYIRRRILFEPMSFAREFLVSHESSHAGQPCRSEPMRCELHVSPVAELTRNRYYDV